MNGINKAAKKVSELYERLFARRYLEIQADGRIRNVWCSKYAGIAI